MENKTERVLKEREDSHLDYDESFKETLFNLTKLERMEERGE